MGDSGNAKIKGSFSVSVVISRDFRTCRPETEQLMPSICHDMYSKLKADLLSDMSVWSCRLLVWPLQQMAAEGRKRNVRFRLRISSVNGEVGIGRDVQACSLYAEAFKVAFTLVIFFSSAAENPSELLCFCVLFGYSGWASFECFG